MEPSKLAAAHTAKRMSKHSPDSVYMSTVNYAFISLDRTRLYQQDAAETLADIFETGVSACGLSGNDLADAFIVSGLARQFELLNPVYVSGKSGIELVAAIAPWLGIDCLDAPSPQFEQTPDWWLGWSLALYQTKTGRPYRTIFNAVPYDELRALYWPLHEAPESKFAEILDARLAQASNPTNLAQLRANLGLSQLQLSQQSGVGLRSIQMYEQRNKDINKAQTQTLFALSRTLCCSMEDLLELLAQNSVITHPTSSSAVRMQPASHQRP